MRKSGKDKVECFICQKISALQNINCCVLTYKKVDLVYQGYVIK